ncbi:Endonuclease YncB, thermonuclease family [Halogranum gelatinilyticum]|uniref:Endonuclease YncB, thermonuclease family n=1 Tax=Halogranum gelatinilyticum TaxID=660521 RepID=A0A1G9VV37_9EURY|nr:DUF4350 domain-containing protein [Halogranum gelatinilyticum]SDM75737.1 Endonuclease YncB, thermonuclease family [Halogranum gelatinilyticum]
MRRRSFLRTVGVATAATSVLGTGHATRRALAAADRIPAIEFDSTASLLAPDRTPLTDDSHVAVWAEASAFNVDEDGDGDAVSYPDSTPIPLVAVDDAVVGFGAPIAQNDANFVRGNEEFVLNVLDAEAGSGTVAFDTGHDQFYDPSRFEQFIGYTEANGYDVVGTDDLAAELPDASAAIVTSPASAFSQSERSALQAFVADGGALLLFDQSDFRNFDATANLNAIADALDLAFRFNDDQVLDPDNNVGPDFIPLTSNFNTAFPYFADRPGLGFELDAEETYTVDVVSVTDGDTVDVQFDNGREETVRVLGIDTPETPQNRFAERAEEWEGIESYDYLGEAGLSATEFAQGELEDATIDLGFDTNEPVRDAFNRLLGYISYDADGTGERDTLYNRRAVEAGHARLYDSSFAMHDDFFDAELAAREAGRNVWTASDPENSTTIRNDPVDSLFFPNAAAVRTSAGALDPRRAPVSAESSATVEGGSAAHESDEIPLVGIDGHARVAMVGAPLVDESYEEAEGYPVSTADYGNFVFLTHLVDRLSDREGDVLIDGGHGQFGVGYALSAEDAAYYQRYLEGVGVGFEGVNTITRENLDRGRALLVTAPVSAFSDAELEALRAFVADGGAVVLLGGDVPPAARDNLDAVADALCSDLRLDSGRVVDTESNLDDDPDVPVTGNVDDWFRLFGSYDGETTYKRTRGGPGRPGCSAGGKGKNTKN